MRNTLFFVVATLLLVYGAWWQYQLVQNLSAPLPTTPATTTPVEPASGGGY